MDLLNEIKTVDTVVKIAEPIIERVTTRLTPEMKDFAERLYTLSEKYPSLEKWAEIVEKWAEVLTDVLFLLGINCDPADELGLKAEQANKNMSDFDTVEEYIKYLHDEVELDKAKIDSLSEEEKMAYRTAGMAVEAETVSEKLGVKISPEFVMLMSKIKSFGDIAIETTEMVTLLKSLNEKEIKNTNDVCEYFSGEGESDRVQTGRVLKEVFSTMFNNKAEEMLETIKMQARDEK